jgi:hypothetical protein
MKKILILALLVLVFLATGISAAKVPDLQGNWTGSWSGYDNGKGYPNLSENGSILFNVDEQKDRLFAGNLTIKLKNETTASEVLPEPSVWIIKRSLSPGLIRAIHWGR